MSSRAWLDAAWKRGSSLNNIVFRIEYMIGWYGGGIRQGCDYEVSLPQGQGMADALKVFWAWFGNSRNADGLLTPITQGVIITSVKRIK